MCNLVLPWSTGLKDSPTLKPGVGGNSSRRVCPPTPVLGDKEKYSPVPQSGTYSGLVDSTRTKVTAVEKTDKYISPSGFSNNGLRDTCVWVGRVGVGGGKTNKRLLQKHKINKTGF